MTNLTEKLNSNHLKKCVCNFCLSKWVFSIGETLQDKSVPTKKITILALGLRPIGDAVVLYSEHRPLEVKLGAFKKYCEVIHCHPNVDDYAGTYNYWTVSAVQTRYERISK